MAKTSFFEEGVRAGEPSEVRKGKGGRMNGGVGKRKGENEKPVETWGWSRALPTDRGGQERGDKDRQLFI